MCDSQEPTMREKQREYGRRRGLRAQQRREALIIQLTKNAHEQELDCWVARMGPRPRPLVLGYGRCNNCGRDMTVDLLEVDHMDGRDWELHTVGRWTRFDKMWAEYESGVRLQALCRPCNARGGGRRYYRRRR
jgi:hypothetical protein